MHTEVRLSKALQDEFYIAQSFYLHKAGIYEFAEDLKLVQKLNRILRKQCKNGVINAGELLNIIVCIYNSFESQYAKDLMFRHVDANLHRLLRASLNVTQRHVFVTDFDKEFYALLQKQTS